MPRWQGVGGVSGTLAVARSRTRWPLAAARSALPFILATALSGKVCIPPRPARPPRATLAPAARLAVPQRGYGQAAALTPLAVRSFRSRSARNYSSVTIASREKLVRCVLALRASAGSPAAEAFSSVRAGSPWPPRKRLHYAPRVGPPARRRELGCASAYAHQTTSPGLLL